MNPSGAVIRPAPLVTVREVSMDIRDCVRCHAEARISNFREVEREMQALCSGAHPDELAMAREAYDAALELLPATAHTCREA